MNATKLASCILCTMALLMTERTAFGVPLDEWSNGIRDMTPNGGRVFLGQFGPTTTRLSISSLPSHKKVTISFNLFVIRSWDGSTTGGPDIWRLGVNDSATPPFVTTFHNYPDCDGCLQAYPGQYPQDAYKYLPMTEATERFALGYDYGGSLRDAVYLITKTFNHTGSALQVDFTGNENEDPGNESWGVDNVNVILDDSTIVYTNDFDNSISPINDNINQATVIGGIPFTDTTDTTNATTDSSDPSDCSANLNTIWYSITTKTNSTLFANANAVISVFNGTPSSLNPITCGYGQVSIVTTPGTTYYLKLSDTSGIVQFSVRQLLALGADVKASGKVTHLKGPTTTATVSGNVSCTDDTTVNIVGLVKQPIGRKTIITGRFSQSLNCFPPSSPWAATVSGDNGQYGGGQASVDLEVNGCGPFNCDGTSVTGARIKLK